ncbi:MAG: ATP-dependent helicase [Actinobacteria bacterium]|nr:ATP-dependent helicase [Actinomycetota bacterium]
MYKKGLEKEKRAGKEVEWREEGGRGRREREMGYGIRREKWIGREKMDEKEKTSEQEKIIESSADVKRVIAGAGSGKTRIITESIIRVLRGRLCEPYEILALTFTKNAAENMRTRVKEALGKRIDFENIDILTFHSFGNEIIKENSFELGLGKDFKLISSAEAWQIIYSICKEKDFKKIKAGKRIGEFIESLLKYIWTLKNNLISIDDLKSYIGSYEAILKDYKSQALAREEMEIASCQEDLLEVYLEYENEKKRNNFIDYPDQIFLPYLLLSTKKFLREKYKKKYRYIFVDEFQDTNVSQVYLLLLLYEPGYNKLTIVGDDDQGIYSFRGACVENILYFHNWDIFREVGVNDFYLTKNYRSGGNIIKAINNVISSNKRRFPKELVPEKEHKPSKVVFFSKWTHKEEASEIVKIIRYLLSYGVKLKDMAIIARRKRFQTIIEELEKNEVRYEVVGGKNFFFEPEIIFLVSWLRVIQNIYDELSITYLLRSPKYKICNRDIYFLKRSHKNGKLLNLMDGILSHEENPYISNITRKRLHLFLDELNFYIAKSKSLKLRELVSLIFDYSGMKDELKSRFGVMAQRKIRNVESLIKISSDFEQSSLGGDLKNKLESFITYLKDVAKGDYEDPEGVEISSENSVKLMSIHASKGLEFEVVFLPMLWEGDFLGKRVLESGFGIPSHLRKDSRIWQEKRNCKSKKEFDELLKDIKTEEERRIFYVGCSRAKKILVLSYSPYLEEVDEDRRCPRPIVPFFYDMVRNGVASDISIASSEALEFMSSSPVEGFTGRVESYEEIFSFLNPSRDDEVDFSLAKNPYERVFKDFPVAVSKAEEKLGSILNRLNRLGKKGSNLDEVLNVLRRAKLDLGLEFKLKLETNVKKINLKKLYEKIKFLKEEAGYLKKTEFGTGPLVKEILGSGTNFYSLTDILTYLKCPRLYELKLVYPVFEVESRELELGEEVHRLIKHITMKVFDCFKTGYRFEPDTIFSSIFNGENQHGSGFGDSSEIKKYIEVFFESNLLDFGGTRDISLEQLFYWKLGDYYIQCKTDRVDIMNDGTIRVIDYKLAEYESRKETYFLNQIKAYIGGVSELYESRVEDITGILFFLGNARKVELKFERREIESLKEKLLKAINSIEKSNRNSSFKKKFNPSCKRICNYYELCCE